MLMYYCAVVPEYIRLKCFEMSSASGLRIYICKYGPNRDPFQTYARDQSLTFVIFHTDVMLM